MVKKRNRHREPVGGRQMGTKMYTGAEVTPLLLILKLKSQSTLSIQKHKQKKKKPGRTTVTTRAGSPEAIREFLVSSGVCMFCLEANLLRQW